MRNDNPRRASRRLSWLIAVPVLLALTVASPAVATPSNSPHLIQGITSRVVWKDSSMDVVGGPVAVGKNLVAVVSGPSKKVWLEGLDAATGTRAWRVSETMSYATAGVYEPPAVADGVALATVPALGFGGGGVRLEGIDVATGHVAWVYPQAVATTDLPTPCPEASGVTGDLCIPVSVSRSSITPSLLVLDAKSGTVVAKIAHINRLMGDGLYEAQTTPAVLAGVEFPPGQRWHATVSSLFGGRIYDPNYGWTFNRVGSGEIGTVGNAPSGYTYSLSSSKTVAIEEATGRVLWRDAGGYECDGMVPDPLSFVCVGSGVIMYSPATKKTTLSPGASETIEGFAPRSGKITWHFKAGDPHQVISGIGVPLLNETHVLVRAASGASTVLDLENGRTSRPSPGQVFWCPRANFYSVAAPSGGSSVRTGTPRYYPCNLQGDRVSAAATPSAAVGVVDAGLFVWPDPSGLVAVRS